jgi:hypothetical protein
MARRQKAYNEKVVVISTELLQRLLKKSASVGIFEGAHL